jgi:parallel beta-helix repeat protein
MNRKTTLAIILAPILMGMLFVTFKANTVKANGTIYIRADGSIDPPTASIVSIDNVTYSLVNNIYDSIAVERDNIVVDGGGYVVQGTGSGTGIAIVERNNVTIWNVNVEAFGYGIQLRSANNSNILDNNITASSDTGVWLSISDHNCIVGNNITNSTFYGVYLDSSSNVSVSRNDITNCSVGGITLQSSVGNIAENNITNSTYGIWLSGSPNNSLSENVMSDNRYCLYIVGPTSENFKHSIDPSNLANGKPVYYLSNQSGLSISPETYPQVGYLALVDCADITVENMSLSGNGQGILLVNTNNSKIANSNMTNNIIGIELFGSWNNNLSNNNIPNSTGGIWLHRSSNNTISDNKVAGNSGYGIALFSSSNNNNVIRNTIMASGNYGIYLPSSNNNIFHNNLVNEKQIFAQLKANSLDDGYPSGGNYWSSYDGTDLYCGSNQNETGSDGIGDQPYAINANNIDKYPLMKPYPWNPHDIGVTYIGKAYLEFSKILPMKTSLGQGLVTYFDVVVMNYGDQAEIVNVTAYADSTTIATILNVTVQSRSSTIFTFQWDTWGYAKGNYTISAYAWPVPDETDTTDNINAGGNVLVTAIGDVSGDGLVSNNDIFSTASSFGTQPAGSRWSPNYDINEDAYVGIDDIFIVATHLG